MKLNALNVSQWKRVLIGAVVLGAAADARAAATYTVLNLANYGGNKTLYDVAANGATITGFPYGTAAMLGGVPFHQTGGANQVWAMGDFGPDDNTVYTLSVTNLNIANATGVYSLINTWWGTPSADGSRASVTFGWSDGDTYTRDLYGDVDFRDYNNPGSGFTTQINGTTTQNVYRNADGGYLIDRQWYGFDGIGRAGKTLTSIAFTDSGWNWGYYLNNDVWDVQRLVVAGLTVQSGAVAQVTGAPILVQGGVVSGGYVSSVPEPGASAVTGLLIFGGVLLTSPRKRRVRGAGV